MRPKLKRILNLTGGALAIVGIVFVALRLHEYAADIDFERLDWAGWLAVGGFSLIYCLSNLMLAMGWWNLLGNLGAVTSRLWAVKTYGISQIAKYVPGNIFHLAGRQAMGMASGVAGRPLAKSAVWELASISGTGVLFGVLALPLIVPGLPTEVGVLSFLATMGLVAVVLWRFVGPPVARAFGWYMFFLAISGFLFAAVVDLLSKSPEISGTPWLLLCGAYVLAWLAGLITPGAPAGVGVRELVLLFMLKGVVGEPDLLLAVVLGRIVTVCGDVECFTIVLLTNFVTRIFEKG